MNRLIQVSLATLLAIAAMHAATAEDGRALLQRAQIPGGLIVHVGCGDGALTASLHVHDGCLVQGLDTSAEVVQRARRRVWQSGKYGSVSIDRWDGSHLPFADGVINLLVISRGSAVSPSEQRRALAPGGVTLTETGNGWRRETKPWPDDIDEWGHYLHDAGNNAVADDRRIGPPRSFRWVGSPRWSRHHDKMTSMPALVSAGGRVFYILDEGSTASILLPSHWKVIARDAFSGVVLWKHDMKDFETRMWPLKSGPAQLPRRLVATENRVFVTLGVDQPVTVLDSRTGEVVRTYSETRSAEEIIYSDGTVFTVTDPKPDLDKYRDSSAVRRPWWTPKTVQVVATDADSGQTRWKHESVVTPLTLAVDESRVVFHDGQRVIALDRESGAELWRSEPVPLVKRMMSFFAPTLVLTDGVVLFAGGEEAGLVKSGGGPVKNDTLTAIDAASGKTLWSAPHPPSGYSSPEDLFVIDGTVWVDGAANGRLPGVVTGRDLHTGKVKVNYPAADVKTFWFHHRCHRSKATVRYLMTSRTGIEFIDPSTGHWETNHWTRGGCLYGILPANGLIYTPPHDCACYPEAKTYGFNAMAARVPAALPANAPRLETGPAYRQVDESAAEDVGDWPTYRRDNARSGHTPVGVSDRLNETWSTELGSSLTAPTIADGKLFVADKESHAVYALDADSGRQLWRFIAGGRVDSPPTFHRGAVLFGCVDGWVYSVRARDGELAWRFRVAPGDSRIVAFEQIESPWPVHGSVLVRDGQVWAVAGRSMFVDGGMRLCRLDARTGKLLDEKVLDDRDPETGKSLQEDIKRLNMPVALSDVLSCDDKHVYMRSQVFDLQGNRSEVAPVSAEVGAHAAVQEGETAHLFSSAGFLDDTYFHRAYWMYGRKFEGGWNNYYLAGRRVPAGKMMVCDDQRVYGYGRQLKYYKWTVPMEFHLFAAPRGKTMAQLAAKPAEGSVIRIENNPVIDPAGHPLTVSAWIRSDRASGVVVAHGGGILGYALYIRSGKPAFVVVRDRKRTVAAANKKLKAGWRHLAGVLAEDGELRLYIDGEQIATARAGGPLPKEPADSLQIGGDEGSTVGEYGEGVAFGGDMDDVRIYHAALSPDEVAKLAQAETAPSEKLVVHLTFDGGKVKNAARKRVPLSVVGVKSAPGRLGQAGRFSGALPGAAPKAQRLETWSKDCPVLARAMVLAADKLIVAGPQDVLDEPEALRTLETKETRRRILTQEAAMKGERGGVLRIVSAADGSLVMEKKMPTIPAWDGLAAAGGRLYMCGVDGVVRCLGGG